MLSRFRRLFALVVCGGVLACSGLAVAAVCGAVDADLDVFTHLAPLYLAGCFAGLVFSFALQGQPRRLAALGAIVGLAACGALMIPEFLAARVPAPPPRDGREDLKIIEFNTLSGNKKPEQALEWLLRQDADVLVLTEAAAIEDGLARRGRYHQSCGNCDAQILTKAEPTWTNTPANWRIKPDQVSVVSLADSAGPITVLAVHRSWQPIDESLGVALIRLDERLQGRPVDVRVPVDLPLVYVDDVLLEQVFLNLLDNAVKYTDPGTPITVKAWLEDFQVMVEVADRGPGIPPGEEAAVFRKFHRAPPGEGRAAPAGSGLGLTICEGIIAAHGGRIWAELREGGGAAFRFTLPLEAAPPPVPVADSSGMHR